jgi:hypothetical protein
MAGTSFSRLGSMGLPPLGSDPGYGTEQDESELNLLQRVMPKIGRAVSDTVRAAREAVGLGATPAEPAGPLSEPEGGDAPAKRQAAETKLQEIRGWVQGVRGRTV